MVHSHYQRPVPRLRQIPRTGPQNPMKIYVVICLCTSMNTSTQFYATHILSVSVWRNVNIPQEVCQSGSLSQPTVDILFLPPASEGWGKVLFSVCQFNTSTGGYPIWLMGGGYPIPGLDRGHPIPGLDGGYPIPGPVEGTQSQVQMGGTPSSWKRVYPI